MTRPLKRKSLSPQQKKALSYARDCLNDDGENDKGTHKAIPLQKAKERRQSRHGAKVELRRDPDHAPLHVKRGQWRKSPDLLLGAIGRPLLRPTETLRDAQRAWIIWRDLQCRYVRSTLMGGTGGGPASAECALHLTAEQALRLRAAIR